MEQTQNTQKIARVEGKKVLVNIWEVSVSFLFFNVRKQQRKKENE